MPKVAEIMKGKEVDRLRRRFVDSLLEIGAYNEQEGRPEEKKFYLSTRWNRSSEVAEPLLRYIHYHMWMRSKKATGLPKPYVCLWNGWVSDLIEELSDGVMTREQIRQMVGVVTSTFRRYRLAERINPKGKSKSWMVRQWPASLEVKPTHHSTTFLTEKDEAVMQKRIEEEKSEKVIITYDFSKIPMPEPNPDSIMKYLKKVAACQKRLQKAYDESQQVVEELEKENKGLKKSLDKFEQEKPWNDLVNEIQLLTEST